jgi:hypothetical protein
VILDKIIKTIWVGGILLILAEGLYYAITTLT